MNALSAITNYGKDYQKAHHRLQSVYYDLQAVSEFVAGQLDQQNDGEDQLNQVEDRLALIDRLKQKYGDSVKQILNYYQRITEQLRKLKFGHQNDHAIRHRLASSRLTVIKIGSKLSQFRHRIARRLEVKVNQQLRSLYMGQAIFQVRFFKLDSQRFYSNGLEKVAFYLRANPGERFLPLAKSASGGEMSRLMLALKTVFVKHQASSTVVFDEIDTGVSGRVAQAIANKMVMISRHSQVLCITHLPQVAAMSDHHYLVWKHVSSSQTKTQLKGLDQQGRSK